MSRKDTILVAVLLNVGLLTVLFITSLSFDEPQVESRPQAPLISTSSSVPTPAVTSPVRQEVSQTPVKQEVEQIALAETPKRSVTDEGDEALNRYTMKDEAEPVEEELPEVQEKIVTITVKRGDSLERLARANKTTVKDLKQLNNLPNDKLRIGQKLKVPVGSQPVATVDTPPPAPTPTGVEYYIVESGDNPWKIAKKKGVSYSEILRLNNLDEAKAKNLKIGQKIRIR